MIKKIKDAIINKTRIVTSQISSTQDDSIFHKIVKLLLVMSPLIVSSIVLPFANIQASALSLTMALIFGLIAVIGIVFVNKKISVVGIFIICIAILLAITKVVSGENMGIFFNIFGYNFAEWTVSSIVSLGIVGAYFFDSIVGKKMLMWVSIPVVYTIANFVLIKYFSNIATYTYYINMPLVASVKILNYAFVYSLLIFVVAIVSFVVFKKGYKVVSIDFKDIVKYIAFIIVFMLTCNAVIYTMRTIAFEKYMTAIKLINSGNINLGRQELDRAIDILPLDMFYADRIILYSNDIKKLSDLKPTDEKELKNLYLEISNKQLSDAISAVGNNLYNYNNYLSLANIYSERAMILNEDVLQKAINNYDKALALVNDNNIKSDIEALKVRLYFGLNKENEGLTSLQKSLEYNSKSQKALFLKSQYLALKKEYQESAQTAVLAMRGDRGDAPIAKHAGFMFFGYKNYNEAAKYFGISYEYSDKKDMESLYYSGLSLKNLEDKSGKLEIIVRELERVWGVDNPEIQKLKETEKTKDDTKSKKAKK